MPEGKKKAGPPLNKQLVSTRAVVGLDMAEQGQKTGKQGLCNELQCHKHKQEARRNTLQLKLSSDNMVTRQLEKVSHELTLHCEWWPCGKDSA